MSEHKYQIHKDPKALQKYARIQDFSLIPGGADWSDHIFTAASHTPDKHSPPCQHIYTASTQNTSCVVLTKKKKKSLEQCPSYLSANLTALVALRPEEPLTRSKAGGRHRSRTHGGMYCVPAIYSETVGVAGALSWNMFLDMARQGCRKSLRVACTGLRVKLGLCYVLQGAKTGSGVWQDV